MIWLLLAVLVVTSTVEWLMWATRPDRDSQPGNLREAETVTMLFEPGQYHAYVPNRKHPGQCAQIVDDEPCLMSKAMHDE